MTTKFWTTQNRKVGTAHHNRDGRVVDFRPADKSVELEVRFDGNVIVLRPPAGVEIKSLAMPARRVSQEVIGDQPGYARVRELWQVKFEDVELSCTYEVWEKKDTPEAEEFRAAEAAKLRAERKARDQQKAYVEERLATLTAAELATIATPTASEWGKLEHGNWRSVLSRLVARAIQFFNGQPVPSEFVPGDPPHPHWMVVMEETWKEEMLKGLLQIREGQKAERKQDYLRKAR